MIKMTRALKVLTQTSFALAITAAGITAASASLADRNRSVDAYDSNFHTVNANPGSRLLIWLRGDGDTDLDLYVRNRHGRLICAGTSSIDIERCDINVGNDGPFEVEVQNLGRVYNVYRLQTRVL
jgi:hypothetical protein